MEIVTRTRDLFERFYQENSEVGWLSDIARDELYSQLIQFVGGVLHQNFGMIIRNDFQDVVSPSIYDTFEELQFFDVVPYELICDMIEDLFYRIAPYVVDICTHDRTITGVSCSRLMGLDAVVYLELTTFRSRDLRKNT